MKLAPLFLGSCWLLLSAAAAATVNINLAGKPLQFEQPPRLAEVLQQLDLTQPWYWPAAALFQADPQLEQERRIVLQGLARLAQSQNSAVREAAAALQQEISQWQLARRLPISIDYDRARHLLAANPRFEPGEYWLTLTPRPESVKVFGAVAAPVQLPLNMSAAGYRQTAKPLAAADNSTVFLIRLNGQVQQVGTAYWNNQQSGLLPGELIYVPFKASVLPAAYRQLNEQVAELARHRMSL